MNTFELDELLQIKGDKRLSLIKRTYNNTPFDYFRKHENWWVIDFEVFPTLTMCCVQNYETGEKKSFESSLDFFLWIMEKLPLFIAYNSDHYDRLICNAWIADANVYAVSKAIINSGSIFDKTNSSVIEGWLQWYNLPMFDITKAPELEIRFGGLKSMSLLHLGRLSYESEVSFDKEFLTEEDKYDNLKYCYYDVQNTRDLFEMFAFTYIDAYLTVFEKYSIPVTDFARKEASTAGMMLCGKTQPNLEYEHNGKKGQDRRYFDVEKAKRFNLKNQDIIRIFETASRSPRKTFTHNAYLNGSKFVFGLGGLHQARPNYYRFAKGKILNYDVASMYPSIMINENYMPRNQNNPTAFKDLVDTRIKAKFQKDNQNKALAMGLKRFINGVSGAMNSKHNAVYDSYHNLSMCVFGQLALFKIAEMFDEAGYEIIQSNTDGIMIYNHKDNQDEINQIVKDWEQITSLIMEETVMDAVFQSDVNNYMTPGKACGRYKQSINYPRASQKRAQEIMLHTDAKIQPIHYVFSKKITSKKDAIIYDGQPLKSRVVNCYYAKAEKGGKKLESIVDGKLVKLPVVSDYLVKIIETNEELEQFKNHFADEVDFAVYEKLARSLISDKARYNDKFEEEYTGCYEHLNDDDEFRNFLFESDTLSLGEQKDIMNNLIDKGVLNRAVFSGNKSIHLIITSSLKVPRDRYKDAWLAIAKHFGLVGFDEACAHPEKFTRAPGQTNPKTQKEQTLLYQSDAKIKLNGIKSGESDSRKLLAQSKPIEKSKALEKLNERIDELFYEGSRNLNLPRILTSILVNSLEYIEIENELKKHIASNDPDAQNLLNYAYKLYLIRRTV